MFTKIRKIITCFTLITIIANTMSLDIFASETIISIDASVPSEDTGKTINEIFGPSRTRATSMPSATWDWGKGNYSSNFSVNYEYCYTQYYFTGYTQYYTDTKASRNKTTPASDYYTVYLMKGNGQGTIVTSYQLNSTNLKTISFYNLDAGTKYAFVISKANDGSILSGTIKVKTSN